MYAVCAMHACREASTIYVHTVHTHTLTTYIANVIVATTTTIHNGGRLLAIPLCQNFLLNVRMS